MFESSTAQALGCCHFRSGPFLWCVRYLRISAFRVLALFVSDDLIRIYFPLSPFNSPSIHLWPRGRATRSKPTKRTHAYIRRSHMWIITIEICMNKNIISLSHSFCLALSLPLASTLSRLCPRNKLAIHHTFHSRIFPQFIVAQFII